MFNHEGGELIVIQNSEIALMAAWLAVFFLQREFRVATRFRIWQRFYKLNRSYILTMSSNQDSSSAAASSQSAQRQVRVQLTTNNEDIALPENPGPILVPTGKFNFPEKTAGIARQADIWFW